MALIAGHEPIVCHHQYVPTAEGDYGFEIEAPRIKYGRGVLREVGAEAKVMGLRRVALFTDERMLALEPLATVRASLAAAGVDYELYDAVHVEPTDVSFKAAIAFATAGNFDGYVSVGGGSVIDTAKAANLFATYPGEFMDYVNAPIGAGKAVPGPLRPHIACPTTSGTGAECTGMAIFDLLSMGAKTGLVSKRLRPLLGVVDPDVTRTLPATVVACSGFDVLSHALESYTAIPYTQRKRPTDVTARPMSQGANPYSDVACSEALRILGLHIVRAVNDPHDDEARERMMFAATLAGIGFGNAGCHAPHGMSYAVSGLVRDFRPPGYPQEEAMVPHGMSVIVNTPSVARFCSVANPARHLEAAAFLGADVRDASDADAGEALARRIIELMQATAMPNGIGGCGYGRDDVEALTEGAFPQQRLLANAPRAIGRAELHELFEGALSYW